MPSYSVPVTFYVTAPDADQAERIVAIYLDEVAQTVPAYAYPSARPIDAVYVEGSLIECVDLGESNLLRGAV